jgi:hypothetical protein
MDFFQKKDGWGRWPTQQLSTQTDLPQMLVRKQKPIEKNALL